jgi:hypothetical protein
MGVLFAWKKLEAFTVVLMTEAPANSRDNFTSGTVPPTYRLQVAKLLPGLAKFSETVAVNPEVVAGLTGYLGRYLE